MLNRILTWLCFAAVVGRVLVPTALDTGPTSLYKDAAHLFVGFLLAAGWYDRPNRLLRWGQVAILTAFETFAVFVLK